MTKEITKAYIIQQIQDKFKLRDFEPEVFAFSERVVPTYDISQHLVKWEVNKKTVSITSAPTGFTLFTVPQTEKWLIRGYNVVFMASGAYTVTGLYISRADVIYLDMTEGQTVSYAKNLPVPVVLNPGDRLSVYIDSYTSTANLLVYIDVQVEELR